MPRLKNSKKSIDCSTIKLLQAMEMIEEYASQAISPLEQIRIVAQEARLLQNVSPHVNSALLRIIGEIDRIIGGSQWEPVGRLNAGIKAVRENYSYSVLQTTNKRTRNNGHK